MTYSQGDSHILLLVRRTCRAWPNNKSDNSQTLIFGIVSGTPPDVSLTCDDMAMKESESKFIILLAIVAASLSAGAFLLTWQSSNYFFHHAPVNDGYVAPRDISKLIDKTQDSTVSIFCSISKKDSWIGTGWAVPTGLLAKPTSKTAVVTNYHVIKKCINGQGNITVARLYKKEKPAEVHIYDKRNDLAVLITNVKLPELQLSESAPWPGYWVMTLGSAAAYEGSVAFGTVLNVTEKDILITNNISEGNSGGPLVDNEGNVIGMVTWGMDYKTDQYNGARILDVFCAKILTCKYEIEGEATWFEYLE